MCEFPSWIETETGEVYFLEDKDLDLPQLQGLAPEDCVGHSAILRVFPNVKGEHKEMFPCHPQVAKAIREGRMKQMMKVRGYAFVFVNENGKFHRTDGPAVEHSNGNRSYYQNGILHRADGPAMEYADGTKFYYQNGISHRTDGPAKEYANGTKIYYQNDKLHRVDGPAREYADGTKIYYQNNKLHRTDGPAVEYSDGYKEYWIHGKQLTLEEFNSTKNNKQ